MLLLLAGCIVLSDALIPSVVAAEEIAAPSVTTKKKKRKVVKRKAKAAPTTDSSARSRIPVAKNPPLGTSVRSATPATPVAGSSVQPGGTVQTALPASTVNLSGKYTLNFNDADIRIIIEAVAKYTGKNFIIDPQVKGKVTIISTRAMDAKQVYEVFQSILKVHGYAAVPGKDVIKIVPDANAKQEAIDNMRPRQDSDSDEVVTHVIEVRHVDANQLVPILRPLVPQRGHLAAVPSSNVIIISDAASNIARLVTIINRIDQATDSEVEVIPLSHASASEIMRIVNQLESGAAKGPQAPQERTKMVADDRTNSLLISGDKTARLRLRTLIAHLDTPVELGGNTHVVYLRNAVAKDLVPVLTGITQAKGAAPAGAAKIPGGELNIQADTNTNALVITAPPDIFRSLKTVIHQLDVRRAQVMVEAVIAEVSSDTSRELGVQWGIDGRKSGNAIGLVNFNLGTPITAYANLASPPSPTGLNIGLGSFTGTTKIAALLSMLAGDAHTNILSTPSLVTLDNQEAEIVVGQNVPFVTGSFSSTGGTAAPSNPFQTIERKDVGLTLKIKPQINEGDAIKMDVTQEVSSLATSAVAASDVITNKRSIKTSVMVDDGQIVVLGGLVKDDVLESEQKVPGFGDIPLLGWLFRYQKTQKIKTNLMVFIHPSIMKDEKTIRALTGEKYNFIRAEQLKVRERGVNLMADDVSPLIPELNEYLKLPPTYEDSRERQELTQPPAQSDKKNLAEPPAPVKTRSAEPPPAQKQPLAEPPAAVTLPAPLPMNKATEPAPPVDAPPAAVTVSPDAAVTPTPTPTEPSPAATSTPAAADAPPVAEFPHIDVPPSDEPALPLIPPPGNSDAGTVTQ